MLALEQLCDASAAVNCVLCAWLDLRKPNSGIRAIVYNMFIWIVCM